MKKISSRVVAFVIILLLILAPDILAATRYSTASYSTSYQNLVGATIATHTAITHWSWGDGYLKSAHDCANSWSCGWLISAKQDTAHFDYYNTSFHGFGQSHCAVIFTAGIPTKWGPIGSNAKSTIFTSVSWYGNYSSSSYR